MPKVCWANRLPSTTSTAQEGQGTYRASDATVHKRCPAIREDNDDSVLGVARVPALRGSGCRVGGLVPHRTYSPESPELTRGGAPGRVHRCRLRRAVGRT